MFSHVPETLLSIVEELRRMSSVEQVKRQQALDIIKAYEPKRKDKC